MAMTMYQWVSLIPSCIIAGVAITTLLRQIDEGKKRTNKEEE
jgi:hypothetical protein